MLDVNRLDWGTGISQCRGGSKAILGKARFPQNAKAVKSVFPAMDGGPFSGQTSRRQIHDLQHVLLANKRGARPERLPQAQVERFDGVGRVDDRAYFRGKLEKADDVQPIPPPQSADRWVSPIPLLSKIAKFLLGFFQACRAIDQLQIPGYRPALLPAHVV